jgi:hypothetical protein
MRRFNASAPGFEADFRAFPDEPGRVGGGAMTSRARIAFASIITFSSLAFEADAADLSPEQKKIAECMFAVVKAEPGVKNPQLNISSERGGPPLNMPSVHISFTYRHRDGSTTDQNLDVASLLADDHERHWIMLGGIVSIGGDLNDADSGMLRITDRWRTQCGLDLVVTTG